MPAAALVRSGRSDIRQRALHEVGEHAARLAARLLEDARRAALDDGTCQGPLVIGSLETTAALRLGPVLTAFAAAYSTVDLTLPTGTTCEQRGVALNP